MSTETNEKADHAEVEADKKAVAETVSQQTGRDGAYVEMQITQMDDMIQSLRVVDGKFSPRMLVLKAGRVDLSGQNVGRFLRVAGKIIDSAETEEMDNAQQGVHLFRKIFEAGLEKLDESKAVQS